MVTAVLRESGCERGGRAAILVQYTRAFYSEIALLTKRCNLNMSRMDSVYRRSSEIYYCVALVTKPLSCDTDCPRERPDNI